MAHQWHLRTWTMGLLGISSVVTFLVMAAVLYWVRLPQITAETRAELGAEAADLSHRSEIILGALEVQLKTLASLLESGRLDDETARTALERGVARDGAFVAIYHVGGDDRILRAAVSEPAGRGAEMVGNDLSRDPLLLRVRARGEAVWSDKYISPVSGRITVGVGVKAGDGVVMGEVPLEYVLKTLRAASSRGAQAVSVLDRRGEVLADSAKPVYVGALNLAGLPLFVRAAKKIDQVGTVEVDGVSFDAALAYSKRLEWYFLVRSPGGLANPRLGPTLDLGVAALVGSLLLGLLLAPFWATGMTRPIAAITERARRVADGQTLGNWPRGRTKELNALSSDLERMANVLQAREQELAAIFDGSPVGIGVLDPNRGYVFIKANEVFCELLGLPLAQLLGKNSVGLSLWLNSTELADFRARLSRDAYAQAETYLCRVAGEPFLAAMVARNVNIAGELRTVWVIRDVTELRRFEQEIRQLNTELEARVEKRTEQLNQVNAELSTTVARLQLTLGELVRAEKLASLGALVAGIAHELNTPLGNGVMAISSVRGALNVFRSQSAEGLRRSMLDQLVTAVDTGTDIAARNLTRAAELVSSFKQVAVDQTSSQRRRFDLEDVTSELLVTLQPLLKRANVAITSTVAEQIRLDSYPGPLGQVLTNLVTNAVTHAFAGRKDGRIHIEVTQPTEWQVCIRVRDNGCGIPAALLPRIFDPFVTTRMGSGGTGLGLHIAHNLVTQVLGGTLAVDSEVGVGTLFTLHLPLVAPVAKAA